MVGRCKVVPCAFHVDPEYRPHCTGHGQSIRARREARANIVRIDGWTMNNDGYLYRTIDGKMTLQHRWVMEQKLGRRLIDPENVHHMNGNRSDNRITNLELWSTSQPAGQRVVDKLVWAREIIALYG